MLKPLKTEMDYNAALEKAYELIQSDIVPDSIEADELEVLTILIQDYESKHYFIGTPNPIEAIQFRLDQMNLDEQDLSRILGSRSRKSEILSGKRKLSLNQIRRLKEALNIPPEILIQAY